jgi:hypothetical protein
VLFFRSLGRIPVGVLGQNPVQNRPIAAAIPRQNFAMGGLVSLALPLSYGSLLPILGSGEDSPVGPVTSGFVCRDRPLWAGLHSFGGSPKQLDRGTLPACLPSARRFLRSPRLPALKVQTARAEFCRFNIALTPSSCRQVAARLPPGCRHCSPVGRLPRAAGRWEGEVSVPQNIAARNTQLAEASTRRNDYVHIVQTVQSRLDVKNDAFPLGKLRSVHKVQIVHIPIYRVGN